MARFFKYRTLDALRADAERRQLTIPLADDLAPLLEPIRVGDRTVGNRLAIQPMEGCDGLGDGKPGELTMRRYRRFGAGGAKLIWMEAAAVTPAGRANPRQLVLDADNAPAIGQLLEVCRAEHRAASDRDDDLLIGLQLTHSGRYSFAAPIRAECHPTLDARTIVDRSTRRIAGPDDPLITDDDLDALLDRYVAAAGLAYGLGFDFVDIKQCHGYLLNELLGARRRPGRYGGPWENRTRFITELVGRIAAEHPGRLIATRLNVYDGIAHAADLGGVGVPMPRDGAEGLGWGLDPIDPTRPDLAEPLALIGRLVDFGLGLLNVTMGNPYTHPHYLRPFEYPPPDGYQTPEHPLVGVARHFELTALVQAAFPALPVVGSGYSWLQAFAPHAGAANIRERRVSFAGFGRASLSHPDFGRFVRDGKPLDPKRICRTFSYCTALMRSKHNDEGQFAAGCPPFDKIVYGPIWDEARGNTPAAVEESDSD